MTDVVLSKTELEGGRLPLVCIASGDPVEALSEIAIGPSKIPQIAGLPTGMLSKDIQTKLFGSAVGAKVGRAGGVKNKQTLVFAARIIFGLGLLYNAFGALTAANLVMVLVSLIGIVGVVVIGGAWLNRALTVGVNATESEVTISGAHQNFIDALEATRSGAEDGSPSMVRPAAPLRKPVPAAGLY